MPFSYDELERFQPSWLSQMGAAVTVLDLDGRLLFYNDHAPSLLDRKPAYLGRPVQELHRPASAAKIDAILAAYRQGQRGEFSWRVQRGGKTFVVRVVPWLVDDQIRGLIHVALPLPGERPTS